MFFVLIVIVGSPPCWRGVTAFCCNVWQTMHAFFGSATGFDFSFGNYRSITKISFLYFVFQRGSSLYVFIFDCTGSHLEERGDVFWFLLMQQFSFTPIFLLFSCYLKRDFRFFVLRCVYLRTFLLCLRVNRLWCFLHYVTSVRTKDPSAWAREDLRDHWGYFGWS